MSVGADDVRRIAALARLGVEDARVETLAAELNRILEHMDVLRGVDTESIQPVGGVGAAGMPLRDDAGQQIPLAVAREAFAPQMREGFLLVPRLSTHQDAVEDGA